MTADLQHGLERSLRAGTRAMVLVATEERRAVDLLEAVGETLGLSVRTWAPGAGVDGGGPDVPLPGLLHELAGARDDELWVLLDGLSLLTDPVTRRRVRGLAQRTHGPAVIFVDPVGFGARVPAELFPELPVVELAPPGRAELEQSLAEIASALADGEHADAGIAIAEASMRLAATALGLELRQVDRLIAEAILEHGADIDGIDRFMANAKPSLLDRGGLLAPALAAAPEELGGMAPLKQWLQRRRLAFDPRARRAGIAMPRGVLLLGVQGCGKSLAARATAGILELPIVRLDMGRLFGGIVGASEANLRRATASLERIAPVVLWLDEIDKGLAGADGAASDAGTSARVLGTLLTWLAERSRPVFVVATANRIDRLPPELLRRGRLDELFFIDLPDAEQREEILRVHLEVVPRRTLGEVPATADPWPRFAALARAASGMSGAELEGALTEARLEAFGDSRDLAAADLARALDATVPLSVSRAEEVDHLRQWAAQRARRAS